MAELTINADEIASALRTHVESFSPSLEQEQLGRVLEVGDGVARVAGLPNAAVNELLEFGELEGGAEGLEGAEGTEEAAAEGTAAEGTAPEGTAPEGAEMAAVDETPLA